MTLLEKCKMALYEEAKNIEQVADRMDDNFLRALDIITNCNGKVVLVGVGKSGIIARKIASTFSSIGKPSIFLHANEAQHGDLGIVSRDDAVICISHSGNTEEIIKLIPSLRMLNIHLISITSNPNSKLAKSSDITLLTYVEEEVCPANLAPTTSTTVTLAVGDALAVGLAYNLKLTPDKFALTHPSGSLGKKLLMKIEGIMAKGGDIPMVERDYSLKSALIEITKKRLGFVCITDEENKLEGIITDGDIRRLLGRANNMDLDMNVSGIMTANPKTCYGSDNAYEILKKMNLLKINCMPVTDKKMEVIGAIHIQDLIKEFGSSD